MKVLIVGENACNEYVDEYFASKGVNTVSITDVFRLRSLSGEVGHFTAVTKDDDIKADFIILTEHPSSEPIEIAGLPTDSLYENNDILSNLKTNQIEPVVFLLDYVSESSMAATIIALDNAAKLARFKRQVFYLSRFVRTAGHGVEALYREAREVGVTFIKYENLQINSDQTKEEFTFLASDGSLLQEVTAKKVFADSGWDTGERFDYAAAKLNLSSNRFGFLTEDMYFLSPVLTSRRGVYHLTRDLAAERLDEGLEFIYRHFLSGINDELSLGTATIDGKKCVFCYNCYRACPHAALEPDKSANQMQCLSEACAGCGICAGICPGNAITLEKDIDGIGVGECNDSKDNYLKNKKTLLLCCENSAVNAIGDFLTTPEIKTSGVELSLVPCGGFIDTEKLTDLLSAYKMVLSVVCPDDACRHFDGNKRACAQVNRLSSLLDAAGLAPDRVRVAKISQAMPGVLFDELQSLVFGT